MPTRTGNVLRAGEDRPRDNYGLDAVIVWPRLWLLLPDTARQELATARAGLDTAVAAVVWGALFAAASPIAAAAGSPRSWWPPAVAGVTLGVGLAAAASSWWVPQRAVVFADLLDAVFDLHRFAVYLQLRWPPPVNPAAEPLAGQGLTSYLWRGSRSAHPEFTSPPPE